MKNKRYKLDVRLQLFACHALHGKRGFTLIELIIVVSIIALLSGVSLFALSGVRDSGRDAKRKADLEEIASGLELYKADRNGYPNASLVAGNSLTAGGNTYIKAIPADPNGGNYPYQRSVCSGGLCTNYKLWARLEAKPAPTPASYCGSAPSCPGGTCNYCITNP